MAAYLLKISTLIPRRGYFKQFSGWDISHQKCFGLICSYMTDFEAQKQKSNLPNRVGYPL